MKLSKMKEEKLTLKEYLRPFLKEIDFLSMATESILNTVGTKNIFENDEILAIIQAKHTSVVDASNTPNYPSYLRTRPRLRRFNMHGGNIKICKLIRIPFCHQLDSYREYNEKLLFTFQSSKNFKLIQINGPRECFKFSCLIGISDDCKRNVVQSSPFSAEGSWHLIVPLEIRANTTYFVNLLGIKHRSRKHSFRMYSTRMEGIEITGESIMCNIEIGFRI